MNSIRNRASASGKALDQHIEAARQQFDADDIAQAARRFREKLVRGQSRQRRWRLPALVGAASVALMLVFAGSLFIPGNSGTAFAQAQQWLESFRTLRAETTVVAGDAVSSVVAWLDASGDTRVESLGSTTIIKPDEGMIYMLRADGGYFAQRITSERIVGSATEFLDNIREFRGDADLLTETRIVDGISAVGYALQVEGATNVLWIDPADGRPLLVEAQMPGGQTMRTVLTFDLPLPEDAFDIPDGVQPNHGQSAFRSSSSRGE
jgi:hypothetical protein